MASFEDRLTQLETVVERLERGELSLEESVRLFEEGVTLSNSCKLELERAEGRIQVLVETEGGGVQVAEMDLESAFPEKEEPEEDDEESVDDDLDEE